MSFEGDFNKGSIDEKNSSMSVKNFPKKYAMQLRFGDCAELIRSNINPTDNPQARYIGLEHIEQNSLQLNGYGYARDVSSQKTAFRKGDILFGKLRPYFRKVIIAPFDGVCSTDIWVIRPKHSINRNFLFYWIASKEFIDAVTNAAEGTRMPRAKWEYVSDFNLSFKSIFEQKEIGDTLRMFDDRIVALRETNATLEAIAQTLFKSWFIDFDPVCAKAEGRKPEGIDAETAALFPDSFEESELGLVPKGWKVRAIGEVVQVVGGGTPSTIETIFWQPEEHHWVTPRDLSGMSVPVLLNTDRKISTQGLAKISSGILPVNTLLMSSRAPIGYLVITKIPTAINQGFIAILPHAVLSPVFLLLWCKQNIESIKQKANGSTFMEISKSAFRPIPMVYPSTPVVKAFNEISEPIFEKIVENELQTKILLTLRDILLPRLISGQLQIPEVAESI